MPSLASARASTSKEAGVSGLSKVAVVLRAAQLFAHASHNLVKGPTFFSDHEWLGETYAAYESAYDSVIERALGIGERVDITAITEAACEDAEQNSRLEVAEDIFRVLLAYEESLCSAIDEAMEGASNGTQDLLQALCSAAEIRRYMLRQRLAD